jgi:hypothetical protein
MRNVCETFVGKYPNTKALGRLRGRSNARVSVKTDVREVGVEWIELAQKDERNNGPSGSFLQQLSRHHLLKVDTSEGTSCCGPRTEFLCQKAVPRSV